MNDKQRPAREEIIALREEADKFATNELSCEGEYHPDFHTVSDERFYAIAFEAGRQTEREECAKVCENSYWSEEIDWWLRATKKDVSEKAARKCADAIRARGDMK